MSKPKYRWWGYVRRVVRDYPKLKEAKVLTQDERRELEAVEKAIEQTRILRNGDERMALIQRAYWRRGGSPLRDVALHLFISEDTAKKWHGDFIRLVGECWGFTVGGEETEGGTQ